MPMINGRFYSVFGRYSPYMSNMIHRYAMAAANEQDLATANALAGTMGDSLINQTQGMVTIAEQRAVGRIKAAIAAKNAANARNLDTTA